MFSTTQTTSMLYAQRSHPGYLYQAYLLIKNPYYAPLHSLNFPPIYGNGLVWRKRLQDQGHDGLVLSNEAALYFIAFDDDKVLEVGCQAFP